jgi:putative DNA primase/helicase
MSQGLHQLKAALSDAAEDIAERLFGKPTKRTRRELRWGRKGSISIRIDGRHGARFHSFEAEIGGSMLDAIRFAYGCDLTRAIEIGRQMLGLADGDAPPPPKREQRNFDPDAEEDRAIAEARDLWAASRPIEGRAAAAYLAGRGLAGAPWTTDLVRYAGKAAIVRALGWNWWPGGAVAFPIRDDAGEIRAVQLVAIDDAGVAIRDEAGGKLKRTRGRMAGAALRLPGDDTAPLILAEGPETAASVWMATGWTVWAMTGGVPRADLSAVPVDREIIVAADDDKARSPSGKGLRDAIRRWRHDGRVVLLAKPWKLTRRDKSDFNDLLQAEGAAAVRERIEAVRRADGRTHGRTLAEAAPDLAATIRREIKALASWTAPASTIDDDAPTIAPFKVVRITTGGGKTEEALRELVELARQGFKVVFLGPTHELVAEVRERFLALAEAAGVAVTTAIWRGRDRDNPDRPGETMCIEADLAADILDAGGDPEKLCAICPHREICDESGYRSQQKRKALVWFAASAILYATRPAAMRGAAVAVVDEAFALAGIRDEGRSARISIRDLETPPAFRARELRVSETGPDGKTRHKRVPISDLKRIEIENDIATDLMPIRRRLLAALGEHGDGGLRLDALLAAGMTADLAEEARKLAERLLVRIEITEATTRDGILDLIAGTTGNGGIAREIMLWRLVTEQIRDGIPVSGRVRLYDRKTKDDGTLVRVVEMAEPARIAAGWREIPTLHMDATASIEIIRQRVPHAELVAEIGIDAPHARVVQYVGPAFGKGAMTDDGARLRDAWRWCLAQARMRGGRCLIVTHKAAVERIQANFTVPSWVALGWFGGLAGLDGFGDVRTLIVLGRWGLPPNQAGRIAGIMTGREVPHLSGDWYPAEVVTLRGADGTVATIEADRHPDALAEAVRLATVRAELIQAIGRGRGIRRDAGRPLDVLVLGNTPTGLPLASVRPWQRLSADEAAFGELGVWAEGHGTMAALTGIPAATIRQARHRAVTTVTRPRRESFPSACHARQIGALAEEGGGLLAGWAAEGGAWPVDLGLARIKRAGRQHRAELVAFDRRDLPDVRAWIEDRLAERLAEFAELAGGVPIVTRQDLDAAEPPIGAEVPVEVPEVADQGLDPAEPAPVVLRVPVASATVAQAVAPTILASGRPIVIAAAWGRASGSATVGGQGLAVSAVLLPGRAFASVPLVIGAGPMRAHHVPARRVFVCRPCSVEVPPPAWMARPAGDGAVLNLGLG